MQSHDVAVTVKHFVCNDTEIERMTVDAQVDERTLRELYLRPFERAVKEGGAWGIMSAYNQLDGEHCAENHRLLTDILRDEWGFDGFVVSDWFGVHDAAPAANAGLSLEMPGPVHGSTATSSSTRWTAARSTRPRSTGSSSTCCDARQPHPRRRAVPGVEESVDDRDERALTRRAAIAGTVLLRNDQAAESTTRRRRCSRSTRHGRSASPSSARTPPSTGAWAAGRRASRRSTTARCSPPLTDRIGPGTATNADVVFEPGVRIDRLTPTVGKAQLRTPNGEPGLTVSYVNGTDWDGDVVVTDVTSSSLVRFFGSTPEGVDPRGFSARDRRIVHPRHRRPAHDRRRHDRAGDRDRRAAMTT